MRNCPKCKRISQSDTECDKCLVLFKDLERKDDPAPRIPREPCGWPSCLAEAHPKVNTPTGWLPLCRAHYDQYWLAKPRNAGEPNGWIDTDAMRPKSLQDGYRGRWHQERNQPYAKAPKIDHDKLDVWTAMHGHKPLEKPAREPGEDEDYTHTD